MAASSSSARLLIINGQQNSVLIPFFSHLKPSCCESLPMFNTQLMIITMREAQIQITLDLSHLTLSTKSRKGFYNLSYQKPMLTLHIQLRKQFPLRYLPHPPPLPKGYESHMFLTCTVARPSRLYLCSTPQCLVLPKMQTRCHPLLKNTTALKMESKLLTGVFCDLTPGHRTCPSSCPSPSN